MECGITKYPNGEKVGPNPPINIKYPCVEYMQGRFRLPHNFQKYTKLIRKNFINLRLEKFKNVNGIMASSKIMIPIFPLYYLFCCKTNHPPGCTFEPKIIFRRAPRCVRLSLFCKKGSRNLLYRLVCVELQNLNRYFPQTRHLYV